MGIARIIALAAIAAVAIVVGALALTQETDEVDSSRSFDSAIRSAIADYEVNNELAESAPQQQVVNGWIARDLLEIVAQQNVEVIQNQDERLLAQARTNGLLQGTLALLVLVVIGIAVLGISMTGSGRGVDSRSNEATASSGANGRSPVSGAETP